MKNLIWLVVFFAGAPWNAAALAQASTDGPGARSVAAVGITVSDIERALQFYTDVLGFQREAMEEMAGSTAERVSGVFGVRMITAHLTLGSESIELRQFLAPEGRPIPADSRSNDRWFQHIAIVVSDIDRAYAHLRGHRVRHASTGPQTLPAWNAAAGGISAFYFKDPDGHVLEIIHFPAGKGDPRWQESGDRLFLGIDHTAIVVADTDGSLGFYRDVLGMTVVGGAENYGDEQEHLNNVFGARLRITTLKARKGPGVELLEYLAPSDGRDYPRDTRACDLWHWRTVLTMPSANHLEHRLRQAKVGWVSPGFVSMHSGSAVSAACQVRDPDGHAVEIRLVEEPGKAGQD